MRIWILSFASLPLLGGGTLPAGDEGQPHPVPLTRPALKKALEGLKEAVSRIPPPELTEAEKVALGDRPQTPESRIRSKYLAPSLEGNEFSREPDPNTSLDITFKTMMFWIVSRTNNCYY